MTPTGFIGEGFEGNLYKVTGAPPESRLYAAKTLKHPKTLELLDCGHIVQLLIPYHQYIPTTHFIIVKDQRDNSYSYLLPNELPDDIPSFDRKNYSIRAIVTDFAEGVELFSLYNQDLPNSYFNSAQERVELTPSLLLQLSHTLLFLHTHGITHRDIKAENIIINMKTKQLVLVDFGLCTKAVEGIQGCCGTVAYQAPDGYAPDMLYNYKVDLWSLGSLAFLLCFHRYIYHMDFPSDENLSNHERRTSILQFSCLSDEEKQTKYTALCEEERVRIPSYLLHIVSGLTRYPSYNRMGLEEVIQILVENKVTTSPSP